MSALVDDLAADDFVQEWPQSGERINRENSKKLTEQYAEQTGTSPKMQLKGIRESGDLVVIEGTIDYGNGVPVSYVGIGEFRDGKVQPHDRVLRGPVRGAGLAGAIRRADGGRRRRGVATPERSPELVRAPLPGSGPDRRAAGRQ